MTKNKKTELWLSTCERFVVFMDIMGFKNMVYDNSHEDLMFTMKKLTDSIRQIDKDFEKRVQGTEIPSGPFENKVVKPVIFSDSILLLSNDASVLSLAKIIRAVQYLIGSATFHGIPIKGAMAFGIQTADLEDSLYFGKPLIDAWELQNELYMYGVVLHHTVEKYFNNHIVEINGIIGKDNIRKYETPFKQQGNISHYVIDWMYYFRIRRKRDLSVQLKWSIEDLYYKVSGSARKYLTNTEDFVNWIAQNKEMRLPKKAFSNNGFLFWRYRIFKKFILFTF